MKQLGQIEREYYQSKLPTTSATTSLNQLRRQFYIQELSGSFSTFIPTSSLEQLWLKRAIANNGATPSSSTNTRQLWRELVSSAGLTPTKYLSDNKRLYFLA